MQSFNFFIDALTVEKSDNDSGLYIGGVCSTSDKDLQNEILSVDALKSMVADQDEVVLTNSHKAEADNIIGRVVAKHLDENNRLVIKAQIDEEDPKVVSLWNKVAKGYKMGFSVGGKILKASNGFAQGASRVISGVKLDHVMLTRKPVNPNTFAVALAKALDEDTAVVGDSQTHKGNTMENELEKAGAKFSADTVAALQDIHEAGDDNVKAKVKALLGDMPIAEAAGVPDVDPANLADGDSDDKGSDADPIGIVNKAITEQLDLVKSSIADLIREEIAKAIKPVQPKGETVVEKSEPAVNPFAEKFTKSLSMYLGD